MMNRVVLVGRITHDLELAYTIAGVAVMSFSLAVNRNYVNEQGERDADFIRCVVWRGQAENMAKYVGKGSLIGVDGRIQSRNYETPQGEKRTAVEVIADQVIFLEPKSAREGYEYDQGFEEDDELYESALDIASDDDLPF
jgi:single-strand DNA-binding protein